MRPALVNQRVDDEGENDDDDEMPDLDEDEAEGDDKGKGKGKETAWTPEPCDQLIWSHNALLSNAYQVIYSISFNAYGVRCSLNSTTSHVLPEQPTLVQFIPASIPSIYRSTRMISDGSLARNSWKYPSRGSGSQLTLYGEAALLNI